MQLSYSPLQKIMQSLNLLSKLLENRSGESLQIVADENPILMKADNLSETITDNSFLDSSFSNLPNSTIEKQPQRDKVRSRSFTDPQRTASLQTPVQNFHSYVMSFRDDIRSLDLEQALLSISNDQFQQLEGCFYSSMH